MTLYFPEAEAELYEAAQFYEDRQPGLGTDFVAAIEAGIKEIEVAPRRCPMFRAPMRRRLISKYPYGIIYVIYHDQIVIVAVGHLSRNPAIWLQRLEGLSSNSLN